MLIGLSPFFEYFQRKNNHSLLLNDVKSKQHKYCSGFHYPFISLNQIHIIYKKSRISSIQDENMEKNHLKLVYCKHGIYCKYGPHCRFYHPQRFVGPINSINDNKKFQVDHLSQQFLAMNLNSQALMNPTDSLNQIPMNDAQYQQIMNQESVFLKYPSQKIVSEPKVYEKHKKWQQNSSDSNSDMQSDSDQDIKQKKHKNEKVKEKKNQKLNYLYGQDKIKKQNKKAYHHEHAKKKVDQQSYYLFYSALLVFFQRRHIKEHKRQKIVRFMAKQIKFDPMTVHIIISKIEELEKDGFIAYCCYKKLFKTIVKQNYEMEAIKAKLQKKINIDKKKTAKDAQFNMRFPYPAYVQFLQSLDLLQNHYQSKDTIYLIDGNNCLTTQKHLRYFFQRKDQQSKAEAQIRFRWLISQVMKDPKRCFVFFDDKFDKKIYEENMDRLMSQEEEKKMIQSLTVVYADPGKEADEQIKNKMKELKQTLPGQKLNDIILVTADRVLTQECFMVHPLRRSSGMYFVKFFKKYLKKQAKLNQPLKKTIKRILNYGGD